MTSSLRESAKIVAEVEVIDPDSGLPVHVTIFKESSGGMGGVDSSYLENDIGPVYSPHGNGKIDTFAVLIDMNFDPSERMK
jgi:hypothetical protein